MEEYWCLQLRWVQKKSNWPEFTCNHATYMMLVTNEGIKNDSQIDVLNYCIMSSLAVIVRWWQMS